MRYSPNRTTPEDTPLRIVRESQPSSYDASAPLQFVLNGTAGNADTEATCEAISAALASAGRTGHIRLAGPGELPGVAREAAARAYREHTAVVAVGGDGTINTVAQVAQAIGCAMGVIPGGTFNYFAREHGAPEDTSDALQWLFAARPVPVPVASINDRIFLVNASLGLYPDVLQNRERWQARFGRSRVISLGAGIVTLLRAQAPLRLRVAWQDTSRHVRTLTLFVGNNHLQLEQLGLDSRPAPHSGEPIRRQLTAVILKPVGTLDMIGLILRGAMGQLGSADGVEHFPFHELVIESSSVGKARPVKVAYDGEVAWMRPPITIRVVPAPLWLLKTPQSTTA